MTIALDDEWLWKNPKAARPAGPGARRENRIGAGRVAAGGKRTRCTLRPACLFSRSFVRHGDHGGAWRRTPPRLSAECLLGLLVWSIDIRERSGAAFRTQLGARELPLQCKPYFFLQHQYIFDARWSCWFTRARRSAVNVTITVRADLKCSASQVIPRSNFERHVQT
jgi:hypothetical protein